ncbi:MAG: hypothetical protein OXT65_07945 [Alphaproteobacteria bacterium]|nr:hypothetical protein [Alphaproteobacteria bacterium]
MRHIEASRKIAVAGPTDISSVKYSLVQRLRGAFHVETVGEGQESFSVTAASKTSAYRFHLNVQVKTEPERARILIDGQNEISMSVKIFYVLSLLAVLILSLFSETIDPNRNGIAMNAMFFLVIGGFIIYDHSRKLEEPEKMLEKVLDSVETEFG